MAVRILVGDVRERLRDLPDGSVQCVVTSPPYFGLRDYGTASWDGGDPACDHGPRKMGNANKGNVREVLDGDRQRCYRCGAVRVDNQIGLEGTLAEYIGTLVEVFRDVRRVLRDDGTVWLNLGDSYNSGTSATRKKSTNVNHGYWENGGDMGDRRVSDKGTKPKDLMMVPARVAIALQDDGWYLRSDIIWAKRNCMPESVTDRPTSSHEHIFLLTKQGRYFYDAEAVREPYAREWNPATNGGSWAHTGLQPVGSKARRHGGGYPKPEHGGANQRNVWHLATEPFPEAHFATFPTEIPRRCIKAGTSEKGQCAACGAPWVRVVERIKEPRGDRFGVKSNMNGFDHGQAGSPYWQTISTETTGWRASCACDAGPPVPQRVLDPFLGSGTTLLVADRLGRDGIGIELNQEYAAMAERRITGDAPMFVEVQRG